MEEDFSTIRKRTGTSTPSNPSVIGVSPSDGSQRPATQSSSSDKGDAIVPGSSPIPSEKEMLPEEGTPVGAGTRFARAIRGLWKTTTTEELTMEDDPDAYVSVLLRELFVYLPWLFALCIMGFCTLHPSYFYLTKAMQAVFVDAAELTEIKTVTAFWDYMEGPFITNLHKEKNYDGTDVHHTQFGYILFENKVMGRPRLRQVRVKNNTCTMSSYFKNYIPTCYGFYSKEIEETTNYWSGEIHSGWAYQNATLLEGRDTVGKLATYGGGGYVQELDEYSAVSLAIIGWLKDKLWIDRGTRAVIVDFTVYNANINVFSLVKFVFEFPPTGGVVSLFRLKAQKLLRYVTPMDYFVMACEGVIIIYILYSIVEEILEFRIKGLSYFFDVWAGLDILLIGFSAACIAMNLVRTFMVNSKLDSILKNRREYGNFEILSFWQEKLNDVIAVTLFIAWFRVFKFLGFNATFAELQGTLATCMKDIIAFTVMFTIVFFAFAIWGVSTFGPYLEDFSTFTMANFTLFRIILGDFDFDAMKYAAPTIGPIFFLLYIFAFTFILLNMFMAIFFDTYAEVKEELDEDEDKFDITEYLGKGYDSALEKLASQNAKIADIRNAVKMADVDGDMLIDLDEWLFAMKMKGHSEPEAAAVFAKYDQNKDGLLNTKEVRKMLVDLEEEEDDVNEEMDKILQHRQRQERILSKHSMNSDEGDGSEKEDGEGDEEDERLVEYDEYNSLEDRVKSCEDGIGEIVDRIDTVLAKLEELDKSKMHRRETMNNNIKEIEELMQPGGMFEWFEDEESQVTLQSQSLSAESKRTSQPPSRLTQPPSRLSKISRALSAVSRKSQNDESKIQSETHTPVESLKESDTKDTKIEMT